MKMKKICLILILFANVTACTSTSPSWHEAVEQRELDHKRQEMMKLALPPCDNNPSNYAKTPNLGRHACP